MLRLRNYHPKINIRGDVRYNEPMAGHTTFRVGGPADIFAVPVDTDDLQALLTFARDEGLPWFVLGGGANILVADRGIRGLVISMAAFDSIRSPPGKAGRTTLSVGAGLPISDASAWAANHGLSGLEFIFAMPGSTAGAAWMNARCYGREIFDILSHVDLLDESGHPERYVPRPQDFAYKASPFQNRTCVMTEIAFGLAHGSPEALWKEMREHESDRRAKGHFAAPCAGSMFKNNRAFGKPSGAIIDSLGLRGYSVGGAKVSDLHANIVINNGGATARDIRAVADHVAEAVRERLGIVLEREVLLVGDWGAG